MQLISMLFSGKNKSKKTLIFFLTLWFLFNILQASCTGLHPDEAYYWVYSQFLAWGYFDHPPMVAVFIKAGSFINNTLGLRLFTCVSNLLSIYLLWLIVKKHKANVYVFVTLFSSVLLFHIYSFITTPDAPLFFFAVLFLYVYQQYLKTDKLFIAIILGLISAALLYSKYHGILLLFFILVSNFSLFKRTSFYVLITVALIVFVPHIYWQYQNNFPSLQYHLIDRSAEPYELNFTLQYILTFILMSGPLTGWLLLLQASKQKYRHDVFLKGLKFTFYGIFTFFFLSTFKGEVQAHWPLIGFIPVLLLATISLSYNRFFWQKKWVKILFIINIVLIVACRLLIMAPYANLKKIRFIADFNGYDTWAQQIKSYAKNYPVIFLDGFQDPSLYNYYTQSTKGFDYDSYSYRKTQYETFSLEDSIRNRRAYFLDTKSHQNQNQDTITIQKGTYYGLWLDTVRMYQKVNFTAQNSSQKWKPKQTKTINFKIENPYNQAIDFTNNNQKYTVRLRYVLQKDGEIYSVQAISSPFNNLKIPAKDAAIIALKIKSPSEAGNYKYFISIQTMPFAGSRNSGMLKMNVN